jgi:hypothetical protein
MWGMMVVCGVLTTTTTVSSTSGWTMRNNNLGTIQFYSVAGSQSAAYVLGGAQDNGTLSVNLPTDRTQWSRVTSGDGGYVAIDSVNPQRWYGEYVRLSGLCRTDPGSPSCADITGEVWTYNSQTGWVQSWKASPYTINDARYGKALFIAPFILDPNNANTMLVGGTSLWRSTNVTTALSASVWPAWYAIKPPIVNASANDGISAIAVAPGNSNVIWVGDNNGNVWKSSNGTAAPGSVTWTQVDSAIPNRAITHIAIDASNSNIVYVTLGGFSPYQTYYVSPNIWKSTNGGTTWTAAAGSGLTGIAQSADLEYGYSSYAS